jgi:methionyl-tRNA formyltransferase
MEIRGNKNMKIVFMGTPDFSAFFLKALVQAGHTVCAVVTQPDRPAGRGRKPTPPPVKMTALELGLPIVQPASVKDASFAAHIHSLQADISVVVAFSILPQAVLQATRLGALNMHGSLLPRYRGAAPIQWAVANGETQTGATVFLLDAKMDHGPILKQALLPILPEDTSLSIFEKMIPVGTQAVLEALRELEQGNAQTIEQDHSLATPAPKLKKEDGLIDVQSSAQQVYDRFRGFYSWPGTWGYFNGKVLRIHACVPLHIQGDAISSPSQSTSSIQSTSSGSDSSLIPSSSSNSTSRSSSNSSPNPGSSSNSSLNSTSYSSSQLSATTLQALQQAAPGSLLVAEGLFLRLGTGALQILELQLEGRQRMFSAEWIRGLQSTSQLQLVGKPTHTMGGSTNSVNTTSADHSG